MIYRIDQWVFFAINIFITFSIIGIGFIKANEIIDKIKQGVKPSVLCDREINSDKYLEELPVALIIVDNKGQIKNINGLAREICNISEKQTFNVYDMTYDTDTPLYCLMQTLEGKQLYQEHYFTHQKGEEYKYYLISTAEIFDSQERITGVLLIAWPVSEQSFLGRQLSQRGKLAMLGELAAGTAHEIRNPLTSVRGLIQVLASRFSQDNTAKEYISVMLREIDQINTIIKELLLLARRTTPNLSFASLPAVLDHVFLMVEAEANCHSIKINKHYAADLPLIVLDEDQIKQVFWHLATNAIYAMPNGGELTVLARHVSLEKCVEISFTDNGVGIPKEHITRIFHPFFTTRPEGTGLGLPVSYQIIDNHGGKLSVRSVTGKGSTFIVKLPLVNYERPKAS